MTQFFTQTLAISTRDAMPKKKVSTKAAVPAQLRKKRPLEEAGAAVERPCKSARKTSASSDKDFAARLQVGRTIPALLVLTRIHAFFILMMLQSLLQTPQAKPEEAWIMFGAARKSSS